MSYFSSARGSCPQLIIMTSIAMITVHIQPQGKMSLYQSFISWHSYTFQFPLAINRGDVSHQPVFGSYSTTFRVSHLFCSICPPIFADIPFLNKESSATDTVRKHSFQIRFLAYTTDYCYPSAAINRIRGLLVLPL